MSILEKMHPDQDSFVRSHSPQWTKLDNLVTGIRKKGIRSQSPEDLRLLGILYRRLCSDLSLARASGYDNKLIEYLNGCVGRAYAEIYRDEPFTIRQIGRFFIRGFPEEIRKSMSYILAAFMIFMAGYLFVYFYIKARPEFAPYIVPESFLKALDKGAGERPQMEPLTMESKSTTSHEIMTNNISVGVRSFAMGIFYGIGTIYLLVFNGALLGALAALWGQIGESVLFWSLILPHGVIELPAIFVCGGAGFLLSWALINPGEYTRLEALKRNGKRAALLMLGALMMFVVAAVIEGFFTPSQIPPSWKLAFSGFVILAQWFYFARK